MDIRISTQHFDITEAIKQYVEERATRLQKFGDTDLDVKVNLSANNSIYNCRIQATEPKGEMFHAEDENKESMYKAIDETIEKLEKQFRRKH